MDKLVVERKVDSDYHQVAVWIKERGEDKVRKKWGNKRKEGCGHKREYKSL